MFESSLAQEMQRAERAEQEIKLLKKKTASEFNKGLLTAMRIAHKVSKERRDGRKFGKQIAAWCENTALVVEERIAHKWRVTKK